MRNSRKNDKQYKIGMRDNEFEFERQDRFSPALLALNELQTINK